MPPNPNIAAIMAMIRKIILHRSIALPRVLLSIIFWCGKNDNSDNHNHRWNYHRRNVAAANGKAFAEHTKAFGVIEIIDERVNEGYQPTNWTNWPDYSEHKVGLWLKFDIMIVQFSIMLPKNNPFSNYRANCRNNCYKPIIGYAINNGIMLIAWHAKSNGKFEKNTRLILNQKYIPGFIILRAIYVAVETYHSDGHVSPFGLKTFL